MYYFFFFFSSRRRHTRCSRDWSSDVCSSDLDLALRCGRVFGLDIYGVDTIETADGVAVLEVDEFPNFTAVPNAAAAIADFILARVDAWDVMPVGMRVHPTAFSF